MSTTFKISPRFAGQVELDDYCPRCGWFGLRIKHMPFEKGFPGIMFYLEQVQKAVILDHFESNEEAPYYFGPFTDCTKPLAFPTLMTANHADSDVQLTARPDMMFRRANGNALLVDLKTSKPNGGGIVFRPQYEIQVIGYSWVAEAAHFAKVDAAGLLYCEILHEQVKDKPSGFTTKGGFNVPFRLEMHPVALNYARLTKCLKEMKRLWDLSSPPRGVENCKNCALLSALFNFDVKIRNGDAMLWNCGGEFQRDAINHEYDRALAAGTKELLRAANENGLTADDLGTIWRSWWDD